MAHEKYDFLSSDQQRQHFGAEGKVKEFGGLVQMLNDFLAKHTPGPDYEGWYLGEPSPHHHRTPACALDTIHLPAPSRRGAEPLRPRRPAQARTWSRAARRRRRRRRSGTRASASRGGTPASG